MDRYANIPTSLLDDPRIISAGARAELLYIRVLLFIAEMEQDGELDKAQLAFVASGIYQPNRVMRKLVENGLVAPTKFGWKVPVEDWNGVASSGGTQAYLTRRINIRAAGGNPSPSLRRMIYERDGWKCLACGSCERLSIDHIFPVSRGGRTEEANLQTLCRSCNSRKGAK